ncbi:Alcohol dehydrogenase transcription factor Myb/SANT-like [Popillia japonica]|uniref:Alcohol dehydrogenase transcription factor Myb/SANT-like n=1 Tax=Popillia japonica TaxID=7064 RepID=A0AAW1LA08_POPJA
MFDTEKFINAVENRPALYNIKLKDYSNRGLKLKLWEVALIMYSNWQELPVEKKNIIGKELQTKWKSLRDQFIKARKLERDIKSGASAGKKKKYIYYDQLQFLIHSDESRETVTNLSPDRDILARQMEEVIANIEEGSDSFRAPTPTPTVPIPHASTSTPKTRKRKIQKDDDDGVRAITDILRQSVELQRQEKAADRMGNKAFLASILPFLDKMSDEVVMVARMHIMQVVQAAMRKSARSDIEVQPTTPASISAQSDISTVASIYSLYEL